MTWAAGGGPLLAPSAAETIFAPATAPGRAGIAVVRISGPAAMAALAALAVSPPPPRRAARARLCAGPGGEAIDDGLVLFFPGPNSMTGENVVELHLHGGRAVLEGILAVLAKVPGLRFAEPGEFARRAWCLARGRRRHGARGGRAH